MSEIQFSLSNFKAFGPTAQSISLRPITLVFGPNSAGKSSLLHSLAWLRGGLLSGNLDAQEPLAGINLGGFDQILHRHDKASMPLMGWSIPGKSLAHGIGGWHSIPRFNLELGFGRTQDRPGTKLISIGTSDGIFFRATRRDSPTWLIDLIDWEHPALLAVISAGGELSQELRSRLKNDNPSDYLELLAPDLLPERLIHRSEGGGWLLEQAVPSVFRDLFDAFRDAISGQLKNLAYVPPLRTLPERDFNPLRSSEVWRTLATNESVRDQLNRWLEDKKRFHTPYRLEIMRFLREDVIEQQIPETMRSTLLDWLARSEPSDLEASLAAAIERWDKSDKASFARKCPKVWAAMVQNEMDALNDFFDDSEWDELGAEQKLEKAEQQAEDIYNNDRDYCWEEKEPIAEFLSQDPEMQALVSSNLDDEAKAKTLIARASEQLAQTHSALLLRDLRTNTVVSFQDVGVGISQVIPVVANAYGLKNSLIAIEQPEIHIHPALQAELGDVFIESALDGNKNTFLIETHSEHLILRILRRIRETTIGKLPDDITPITKEDVAVLFVSPSSEGATVRELRITDQGKFLDSWPGGFFEESFDEMF